MRHFEGNSNVTAPTEILQTMKYTLPPDSWGHSAPRAGLSNPRMLSTKPGTGRTCSREDSREWMSVHSSELHSFVLNTIKEDPIIVVSDVNCPEVVHEVSDRRGDYHRVWPAHFASAAERGTFVPFSL